MHSNVKGGTRNKRKSSEVMQVPLREVHARSLKPNSSIRATYSLTVKKKASNLRKLRQVKNRTGIIFAIDTNVFLSKPGVLYGLGEHDIFVPNTVINELDRLKRSDSTDDERVRQRSANARAIGRLLLRHIETVPIEKIHEGVKLVPLDALDVHPKEELGMLYIGRTDRREGSEKQASYPSFLDPKNPDHKILMECLDWMEEEKKRGEKARKLILVSKDVLMRFNALRAGVPAEDYLDDAIDVENIRSTGVHRLPKSFWEQQGDIETQQKAGEERGRNHFTLRGKELENIEVNEFIIQDTNQGALHLQVIEKPSVHKVRTREVEDYMRRHSVFGVNARNIEQNFAFNVLMDPKIPVVILEGPAGSGKNFIALAAMLQRIVEGKCEQIIATRDAIPVGEQTGYKPGSEAEKMEPWLAGVTNNLTFLKGKMRKKFDVAQNAGQKRHTRKGTEGENGFCPDPKMRDFLKKPEESYLVLKEINSMRGASLEDVALIFDENQNSTRAQQKMLLTRPGRNTKVICLGNFTQTDKLFTDRSSGLARVIDITRGWKLAAHIVLRKVERSEVAAFFEAKL